jgi:hypothetical protein
MYFDARRLALAATLVAASAVVRAPLAAAPPVSDEAAHLLGSWTLLEGRRLYVDFVDNKPLLLYAAYASIQALMGRGLGSVRLAAVLLVVPLTAFAASAFFGHDRRGMLAALLYVLLSAASPPEDALPVHAELLMLLPAAWAVVLLRGRDATERNPWPDVVAGGLLGLATLVKPTAVFWLAAAPLALLVCDRSASGLRAAARAGLAAAAGFAMPVTAIALVFAHAGTLDDLVERTLLANLRYVGAPLPPLEGAARAVRGALPWLAGTGAAWWAYARGRRLEGHNFSSALVDALVLCSVPAVLLGGRFYGHYFLQLLFPLCLGAAPGLVRLDRGARVAVAVVAATALGFATANGWLVLARDDAVEDTFPLYRDVAAFLREDTCYPGASVLVWGLAPRLYVETGLRPASRFVLPQESVSGHQSGRRAPASSIDQADRRLLLEDLERSSATYILDLAPSGFHHWDRFPMTTFPALLDLVHRQYEIAGVVDDVVIHRRRACFPRRFLR